MMDQEGYSRTPSRAEQLWKHLCGLFGVDSVKRKYGLKPPLEWDAMLRALSEAQIRNGVDRLSASGLEHVPSLPQFLALCHQAREFEDRSEYERLRAPELDKWAIAANKHLLAHVLKSATIRCYFDPPMTETLVKFKNAWADDMRVAEQNGQGIPIEEQKNAWEDCMSRAKAAGAIGTSRRLNVPDGRYNSSSA